MSHNSTRVPVASHCHSSSLLRCTFLLFLPPVHINATLFPYFVNANQILNRETLMWKLLTHKKNRWLKQEVCHNRVGEKSNDALMTKTTQPCVAAQKLPVLWLTNPDNVKTDKGRIAAVSCCKHVSWTAASAPKLCRRETLYWAVEVIKRKCRCGLRQAIGGSNRVPSAPGRADFSFKECLYTQKYHSVSPLTCLTPLWSVFL